VLPYPGRAKGDHVDFEKYLVDLNAKCACGCMDGKRIHKIYRFPNGYGASVVTSPKARRIDDGGFRLLVIHFESDPPENAYCVDRTTPVTDDVLECDSWPEVEKGLERVFRL
jgi:hypothetical protein